MHSTHLPCNDPERIDVVSHRTFGVRRSEALSVNQFSGSVVEGPIDVHPRHGEWNRNCSKTGKADASTSVDEDVFLDERERVTKVYEEEGSHNLEVPVNDVEVVHLHHCARYC